jgi:hypothetical protein
LNRGNLSNLIKTTVRTEVQILVSRFA